MSRWDELLLQKQNYLNDERAPTYLHHEDAGPRRPRSYLLIVTIQPQSNNRTKKKERNKENMAKEK